MERTKKTDFVKLCTKQGPGADVSIKSDKTGLTDSFRIKIALNIKTRKGTVTEDELRNACFSVSIQKLRKI